MVDEPIGEGFDIKRKLALLRRRRSCRFNCDHFDGITPKTLDIGKTASIAIQITLTAINRTAVFGARGVGIFGYFLLVDSLPRSK